MLAYGIHLKKEPVMHTRIGTGTVNGILLLEVLAVAFPLALAQAEPPTGTNWEIIPELSDEFNAQKLDTKKWHNQNPSWEGRQPGFFSSSHFNVTA